MKILAAILWVFAHFFLVSTMTSPVTNHGAQAEAQSSTSTADSLRVTIFPKNRALHPGDTLTLRVELKNVGYEPIFVPKEIGLSDCGVANLRIWAERGSAYFGPGEGCAADCFPVKPNDPVKNPIERMLLRGWTLLSPGYTYARDLPTYSASKAGRYLIRGDYSAQGIGYGCVTYTDEETNSLPYRVWTGRVLTNSFWMEVTKP